MVGREEAARLQAGGDFLLAKDSELGRRARDVDLHNPRLDGRRGYGKPMDGRETSLSRYHCTRKSLSVLKPLYRAERSYHAGKTTTAEDQAEQEVCTE